MMIINQRKASSEKQQTIALGMPKPKRKRKRDSNGFERILSIGGGVVLLLLFLMISTVLYYKNYYSGMTINDEREHLLGLVQNYRAKNFLSPHAAAVAGWSHNHLRGENQRPHKQIPAIPAVNRRNMILGKHNNLFINTTVHHSVHEQAAQEQAILPLPEQPAVDEATTDEHHQEAAAASASRVLSRKALEMCTRTLWHTLETTTIVLPHRETFIHTGDIDDLWLRDSAAQIHPLLIPVLQDNDNNKQRRALIYDDPRLDRIVSGLIARHALYIRHDPYANAFRIDDTYVFSEAQKKLGRHDLISTWNYELDSACFTIRMLYYYWKQSRDPLPTLRDNPAVHQAVTIMVDLWIAEQEHELDQSPKGPLFDCQNCHGPYRYPGLPRNGKGSPTNASSGLTWTGFRPSDDASQYGYLVPANMFCVVVLRYVQEMAGVDLWNDAVLQNKARQLQTDIQHGIAEHGIVEHAVYGKIYAYEVDGLGQALLMDDANVPSLLSIPYLEYPYDPIIYANTRRFLLSPDNPTFASGRGNADTGPIAGIGSPHMQERIPHNVWPMALAVQALTTESLTEAYRLTEQLVQITAGTGWMHESFNVNQPQEFTRPWFCWADSLYAELVLRLLSNATDSSNGGEAAAAAVACPDPAHPYRVFEWRDPVTVPGGRFASE